MNELVGAVTWRPSGEVQEAFEEWPDLREE